MQMRMPGLRHKLNTETNVKAYVISSLLEPQYRIKFNCLVTCQQIFLCCTQFKEISNFVTEM